MINSKEQLDRLEEEISYELYKTAETEKWPHEPVTDGVVDVDRYLSTSPKMLWILKEPWEKLEEGVKGGGWSVTKDVAAKGVDKNKGALAMMAYVTYSVLNNFPGYGEMDYATENPAIGDSLKCMAYINVKKYPGGTSSNPQEIARHFNKNRLLLLRQIQEINPDIIIGGGALHLFFSDLGLDSSMFNKDRSAWFCKHGKRLLIDAHHPAQWSISPGTYVDDMVQIVKENSIS